MKLLLALLFSTTIAHANLMVDAGDFTAQVHSTEDKVELQRLIDEEGLENIKAKVQRAHERAIEALKKTEAGFIKRSGFFKRESLFTQTIQRAHSIRYLYSGETRLRHCSPKTLAFFNQASGRERPFIDKEIMREDGSIFIRRVPGPSLFKVGLCKTLQIQDEDLITQVLIHEMFHVGGLTSEMQASKAELVTLQFSNISHPLANGYWKMFGLERFLERLNLN